MIAMARKYDAGYALVSSDGQLEPDLDPAERTEGRTSGRPAAPCIPKRRSRCRGLLNLGTNSHSGFGCGPVHSKGILHLRLISALHFLSFRGARVVLEFFKTSGLVQAHHAIGLFRVCPSNKKRHPRCQDAKGMTCIGTCQ